MVKMEYDVFKAYQAIVDNMQQGISTCPICSSPNLFDLGVPVLKVDPTAYTYVCENGRHSLFELAKHLRNRYDHSSFIRWVEKPLPEIENEFGPVTP